MAPRSRNSSSSRGRGLTDDEPFRVLYKMGRTLVSALLLGFFLVSSLFFLRRWWGETGLMMWGYRVQVPTELSVKLMALMGKSP